MSATSAHPLGRERLLLGAALKVAAMFLFALMFAGVKWLGPSVPIGEIVFCRAFFGMAIIAAAALATGGPSLLRTSRLQTHATRSLLGVTAMFCNFLAVMFLPLADATAIGFAAPLFIVILAALILGENVHAYRWSAVAIGFAGVVVIVGPEAQLASGGSLIGALFALAGAGLSAMAMIVLRRMTAHEHSEAIAFYFMLTSTVIGLATLLWGWKLPSPAEMAVLGLMGVFGGAGQLLLSFSYRHGEASVLAPFDYSMMLWAVTLGYFLFGDLPTVQVLIGACFVIGGGLLILWREHVLGRQRAHQAQSL